MRVPVMLVVNVGVRVLERLVLMLMLMTLGQVQPNADAHEHAGDRQLHRRRVSEDRNRRQRADERSRREIGARSRGTEIAQRQNEKDETETVAEETHQPGQRAYSEPGKLCAP